MNKREFIKQIGKEVNRLKGLNGLNPYGEWELETYTKIKSLAQELDEPEKVVIPKFVADWIEECKDHNKSPRYAMSSVGLLYKLDNWMLDNWMLDKDWDNFTNQEKFMKAWLDGYEVEKEPVFKAKSRLAEMDSWSNDEEDYFSTFSDGSTDNIWLCEERKAVSVTMERWAELGVTEEIAIFEEVDE